MNFPTPNQWIDIHTHQKPTDTEVWCLRNAYHYPIQLHQMNYAVSMGIHPWWSNKVQLNHTLYEMFSQTFVLAIGEIGLDRRCNVPFHIQQICFETQLQWAYELNKPVVIHAVKTYADLLPLMKKYSLKWILHGFNGNDQIVKQMQPFEVYFSVGKIVFNTQFKFNIPLHRMLLETDIAYIPIKSIYKKVAEGYQTSIETIKNQIFNNFNQIFYT